MQSTSPDLINTLISAPSNIVMYLIFVLQVAQMVLDHLKDRNKDKLEALTKQVEELTALHLSNKAKIESLENKVFTLETERAKLIGLLSSQETKEKYVENIIKNSNN
jgi:hypothetical protein